MMNIEHIALKFAIEAHKNQVRKSEVDKPMIIHPINVGNILKEYGFDYNVISAGYLHDVIEDTKYTKEDILNIFGEDITSLVMGNTEIDKSLSWEDRKQHTINTVKDLDLRHKAVVCADKISNLEDLRNLFEKNQNYDFGAFKRGFEKQKWYYESVYQSLIENEDEHHPIFERLKKLI
ncbi:MAG: HD domain-containing protein [Firmicutes bacterium]|nr:HD domain-containing protein [Bacillota bacterium]